MEKEKREEIREDIELLDEGIDMEDMAGPRGICCSGAYMPLRW